MAEIRDIEVVVFDILGTLVDEAGGLRAAIRDAAPTADEATVDELLASWQQHSEDEQRRIAQGHRTYANSEVIDEEAARRVAGLAGLADPATVARLATAGRRLPPVADSVPGLERLTRHLPVLGLSNAEPHRPAATRRARRAALAPSPVRRRRPGLQAGARGVPPRRRRSRMPSRARTHGGRPRLGPARSTGDGMRTAYVRRPVGDPPTDSDTFDGRFESLDELVAALTG